MPRRATQLLAFLTACSTVLAGMPLFVGTSGSSRDTEVGVSAAARQLIDVPGVCYEGAAEEREETEQEEEDGDAKLPLHVGTAAAIRLKSDLTGGIQPGACPVTRGRLSLAFAIRGPPACG